MALKSKPGEGSSGMGASRPGLKTTVHVLVCMVVPGCLGVLVSLGMLVCLGAFCFFFLLTERTFMKETYFAPEPGTALISNFSHNLDEIAKTNEFLSVHAPEKTLRKFLGPTQELISWYVPRWRAGQNITSHCVTLSRDPVSGQVQLSEAVFLAVDEPPGFRDLRLELTECLTANGFTLVEE